MTFSTPCRRSASSGARILLGLAIAALAVDARASTERDQRDDTVALIRELAAGPPIVETMTTGESHRLIVRLRAGQYLRLRLDVSGIDVGLRVTSPHGVPLTEVRHRGDLPRFASFIATHSGGHVVELTALDHEATSGNYTIAVQELRRAAAADQAHVRAMRALAEAEALRGRWRVESNRAALRQYNVSAQLWRTAPADQALAYLRLADLTGSMGDSRQSERWARMALKRAAGVSPETECRALTSLSRLALLVGDRDASKRHGNLALTMSRARADAGCEAEALNAVGDVEAIVGDATGSIASYRDARAVAARGSVRRQEALAWLNIGYVQSDTSQVDEARASYDHALTLWRRLGERPQEAVTLNALGTLHMKIGEQQQALGHYLRASEIFAAVGDPIGQGISFDGLGIVYLELGEYAIAKQYYERKLQAHKSAGFVDGAAGALVQIGHCYYAMRDYPHALERLNEGITLLQRINGLRVETYASGLLGLVYEAMGDRPRALATYERALTLSRQIADRREEAYALNRTATLLHRAGQTVEALARLSSALQLSRGAKDRVGESLALFNRAIIERDRGQPVAALDDVRASLGLSETLRTDVASPDLRASYFASVRERHELQVDLLMRLHQEQPSKGFDRLAFDAGEQARARALLDGISQARSGIREGADPALVERERTLARELNAKAQRLTQIASGLESAEAQRLGSEIDALTAERATLDAQMRAQSPRYAALTSPTPLTLPDVQRQVVDDGSVLLQFFVGADHSYLWVVSKTTVQAHVLPGRSRLDTLVRAYRDELAPGRPGSQTVSAGSDVATALADLLLEPAGDLHEQRLLIVPDGVLQLVPFAALPDRCSSASHDPLITRHEVVHLPSASTLALLRDHRSSDKRWAKNVIVFGDPVFEPDDPRLGRAPRTGSRRPAASQQATALTRALRDVGLESGGLSRLLETRREAQSIAAVAPLSTVALGFDADRAAAISTSLADYRIVHFATHGLIDNIRAELSGVVLSLYTRTGQPQDGFLRLHDIYNLTLPVDLVVLSACSTALGREVAGEGLVGLVRGFMYAGSRRVIASLWRVDDEATSEFMGRFYHHLFVGRLTPSAALRAAQLDLLRSQKWQSPTNWAAFVMSGDWN